MISFLSLCALRFVRALLFLKRKNSPEMRLFFVCHLFHRRNHFLEHCREFLGEDGEGLAIKHETLLLCSTDEGTVFRSVLSEPCVQLDGVEGAEVALLALAIDVGSDAGLDDGDARLLHVGIATPFEALCSREEIPALLGVDQTTFYSSHRMESDESLDSRNFCLDYFDIRVVQADISALVARDIAGFARIEVALSGLALQDFAALRDFDALCQCFVNLEFHMNLA